MKIAHFDCSAGIAGDMCLGALIDCGVPLDYVLQTLRGLGLQEEFDLSVARVERAGQPALHAVVDLLNAKHHPARYWPEIEQMISQADLSPRVKSLSLQVFETLAQAEAKVHQTSVDQVHFHEVGAVDAIVDIVGTCIGIDWLKVDQISCSPHPIGGGWIQTAHGQLAVPVPAVIQLWETARVPIFSNGIEAELVTPTGAALATTVAQTFGDFPSMRVERVGCGAGTRELPIPNVLRLWIGDSEGANLIDTVAVLETQIDDLNPQVIAYTFDQLMAAGCLDVFTQPITMKQGRPGTLLTLVCPPDRVTVCENILFRETTTLGIRHSLQQRSILERSLVKVMTDWGEIDVKVARRYGKVVSVQPEFRDCAARAQQHQVPVQTVWLAAQLAWQSQQQG